jgi:hypothetical protein
MVEVYRFGYHPAHSTDEVTGAAERRLRELAGLLQRCSAESSSQAMSDTWRFLSTKSWYPVTTGNLVLRDSYAHSTTLAGVGSVGSQFARELKNVDEALVLVRSRVREALTRGGLNEELADVLIDYVDVKVSTEKAVADIVGDAERELAARRDPAEALSAVDLAKLLGVTDETVRNREAAGELFSILRPGRKRGREYPAFQAWEGVAGAPLKEILTALDRPAGPVAYAFFTSAQDTLAGLSPVEALVGLTPREVSPEAQEFLRAGAPERLAVVVQAAQSYASSLEA